MTLSWKPLQQIQVTRSEKQSQFFLKMAIEWSLQVFVIETINNILSLETELSVPTVNRSVSSDSLSIIYIWMVTELIAFWLTATSVQETWLQLYLPSRNLFF